MDPEAAWRAVCSTCKAALAASGVKRSDIAANGVTGVIVGAWLVDSDGAAVRPAVLWDDGRARDWLRSAEEKHPNFLPLAC